MTEPAGTTGTRRVLLAADRRLVGDAVRMALTSRGFQAACVSLPTSRSELRAALRWAEDYQPRVGVLLCATTETGFVRRAAELVPRVPVPWLLLTSSGDPRRWGGLMQAGVAGVLPMTSSLDEVHTAITRLAAGTPLMSETTRDEALDTWREHDLQQRDLAERLDRLTPRERAVLDQLVLGRSVRGIAEAHGVSEGTVRSQVKAILRKLDVSSQLAAVAIYRDAGAPTVPHSRKRTRTNDIHRGSAPS